MIRTIDLVGYGIAIAALVLMAFIVGGCAGMTEATERYHIAAADRALSRELPPQVLKNCGYDFNLETFVFRVDELEGSHAGLYNPEARAIYYEAGNYSALVHERVHALNHSSNGIKVPWRCLDEALSYMVAAYQREREGRVYVTRKLKEEKRRKAKR